MIHKIHYLVFAITLCITPALYANNLQELEQDISDTVITTKITAKFAEKRLNPLKISIDTDEGVVSLNGYVQDKQAFVDALRIAKETKGVKSVNTDKLLIQQVNMGVTDAFITAKVEAAILKAKVFDDESIPLVGINAKTQNGVVTLAGFVKSSQSITYILNRVNAISGVKKIITSIKVKEEA